jgi:hypothetical protein
LLLAAAAVPGLAQARQSESYSGPITLTQYERFQYIREMLAKEGINIPMPTGN